MKRIFAVLTMLSMLALLLSSCGFPVETPAVKEGKFNFSITYVLNGEAVTLSDVYVCEYDGIGWSLDGGFHREWTSSYEKGILGVDVPICTTEDGGRITLALGMYPEYFMGDPGYDESYAPNPWLILSYYNEETGEESFTYDAEIIAGYGAKIIAYEYDEPIENEFK